MQKLIGNQICHQFLGRAGQHPAIMQALLVLDRNKPFGGELSISFLTASDIPYLPYRYVFLLDEEMVLLRNLDERHI